MPVNAASEVSDAALALCQSKIDVFCQLSDGLTNASFPAISRACESTKTPLFSFASGQIKIGAILSVGSDYEDNGREAGLLAAQVIRGKDPAATPFQAFEEGPPRGQPRQCPPLLGRDPGGLAREGRRRASRRAERPAAGRNEMKERPWIARSAAPTTSPWS